MENNSMDPKKRLLETIESGQELPSLTVDVTATTVVLGALAGRDWQPQHHDRDFAQNRNGMKDIFINTPHNAAYFERYISDWVGPFGRLAKIKFQMLDSVYPGDQMVFHGTVEDVYKNAAGVGWLQLSLWLAVTDKVTTRCKAKIAVPTEEVGNPWDLHGTFWEPDGEKPTR